MNIVKLLLLAITKWAVFANCSNASEPLTVENRMFGGRAVETNSSSIVKIVATQHGWDKNCAGAVIHREYVLTHAMCVKNAEMVHVFINNLANAHKMTKRSAEIPIMNETLGLANESEANLTLRKLSDKINNHGTKHKGHKGGKQTHDNFGKPHGSAAVDDAKDEGKQQMKVEKEVKHNHTVFIHQITSEHIIYEIVLKPEDVISSSKWWSSRISELALLKIPSKEYTQEVIPLCTLASLHQISLRFRSEALSWVGLAGYGAPAIGSLMHGFYGAWPQNNYAKLEKVLGNFMYTNSSTVGAARGDMGGPAFLGQTDYFCSAGVIFDFSERTNMTRSVLISNKATWISNVTGITF